jgi:glycerol-3-phosphate acyltransferase PlsY
LGLKENMNNYLQFALSALVAYLIGSFPTGVIATKLAGAPDVRYSGSGHIGGTNTMRLTNPRIGAMVVVIDGLKGLVAWGVAYIIMLGNGWALPIAGTMAVVGHCWPIYTRFQGGMGLATSGALIFILSPITLAFVIPVWATLFWGFFKKAYSSRAVVLALLIGVTIQILFSPPEFHIRWFLIFVIPILILRHLPEWHRKV